MRRVRVGRVRSAGAELGPRRDRLDDDARRRSEPRLRRDRSRPTRSRRRARRARSPPARTRATSLGIDAATRAHDPDPSRHRDDEGEPQLRSPARQAPRPRQPDVEAVPPSYFEPRRGGHAVSSRRTRRRRASRSTRATSRSRCATCIDGGKMDGFVQNAAATTGVRRHFAMSYYDAGGPAVLLLARVHVRRSPIATSRRWRAARSPTATSCMFGTNAGVVDTGIAVPAADARPRSSSRS